MLAVNVGTGFGAASVIWRDGRWYTCPSEAGHMTLGQVEPTAALPAGCQRRGRALRQRPGAAVRAAGRRPPSQQPSDVFAAAAHEAAAADAVDLFTAILGRIAGDLALATCAWGGVYLCGSVATAWSGMADIERFRAEFIRKGPMRARMLKVPTAVIRRDIAALYGLAMMPISR